MFVTKLVISSLLISSIKICFASSINTKPYDILVLSLKWHRSECCKYIKINKTEVNATTESLNLTTNDPTDNNEIPGDKMHDWDFDCSTCGEKFIRDIWTIHGLWPNNAIDCINPDTNRIDFSTYDKNLLMKMKEIWALSENLKYTVSGWRRQWLKHGNCMRDIPGMEVHESYFKKAIELYNSEDVQRLLNKASTLLDGKYSRKDLVMSLRSSLTRRLGISCHFPGDMRSYLHGLNICFDKEFKLTDCYPTNNCGQTVYYP